MIVTDDIQTGKTPAGRDSFFANRTATVVLTLLVFAYVAFFCATSFMTYRSFGMSAYDIGIHDQALWKLSTLRGFFNTIRGMNIWGDHCWLIMALVAPLYRIAPALETLLAVQSVALAAGAFPLAAYAYRRIGNRPIALLLAVAFLLSPALQNMNLENAHPEVLAVPFILWMIAAAEVDSWPAYGIALLLALFCKEDVALTTFAVGFYVFFRCSKKAGIITMIFSVIYFLVCMKLILPYSNGSGFFRFQSGYWFSDFWAHKFDAGYYLSVVSRPGVGLYAWKLAAPLLGIFLLDPLLLIAALPGFLINILSGNTYLIGIDYHYNYHTLPILFAAAASGIAVIRKKAVPYRNNAMLAKRSEGGVPSRAARLCSSIPAIGVITLLLAAASLAANIAWSQAPITKWASRLISQWQHLQVSQDWSRFKRLTAVLPEDRDIPLAASHNLVPALTHRNEIYMFPNPWKSSYWGIAGEKSHSPDRIKWLVLDSNTIDKETEPLVRQLFDSGEFHIVAADGDRLVAKRNEPTENSQRVVTPWSDDLLNAAPPEKGIRVSVFLSKTPVTSLRPLFGAKPDFEILTSTLAIPETSGIITMSDGQTLKGADNIRVVFAGKWHAGGGEETLFRLRADDGCRLYLDGKMVLDYNGVHPFSAEAVSKPLRLGKGPHSIVVDYFEWGGNAGLTVEWKAADGQFKTLQSGAILP